jgi:hypothetical protein
MKLTIKLQDQDGEIVHEGLSIYADAAPRIGETIDLCGLGGLLAWAAAFYTVKDVTWRANGGELEPVISCRFSCNNSGPIGPRKRI